MPVEFEISNEDITFAESVLLPEGVQFDEERRDFIKSLKTLDVQAVPGSGKTTALLAKLLALDRHLTTDSGQGVLVISHTNAAVNEIRNRIGSVCPKIFTYPNFVGTIQSFVDTFLAIPSFVEEMGFRPTKIDADAYDQAVTKQYNYLSWGVKSWLDQNSRGSDPITILQSLRFDTELNITAGLGGKVKLKSTAGSPTYKAIAKMKRELFKQALLHFEDVFWFAEKLLQRDSTARQLLQQRFKFVFVDEMQDMAEHQHSILENIFGQEDQTDTIFQRIGDTDQAIFGVDNNGWQPRAETISLNNSLRLPPTIAKVLPSFAFEKDANFEITGLQDSTIKPHLLVFNDDSISSVVERYSQLVVELQGNGSIPANAPGPFMAIAWNSEWNGSTGAPENKLRLIDFCPHFRKSTLRKQEEFETLADYLFSVDQRDQTLRSARGAILRGISQALRLEAVINPQSDRPFTPKSLISYFRNKLPQEDYQRFNRRLLRWALNLVTDHAEKTHKRLKKFVPILIQHLGDYNEQSNDFLTGAQTIRIEAAQEHEHDPTSLRFGELEVGLGTVHSVKGQTHTATLYIESAYYNDGGKSYESQRLSAQFKGQSMRSNAGKRVKESARMIYVGFSRPTHLLVFAVHKDNYSNYLADINSDDWIIINNY